VFLDRTSIVSLTSGWIVCLVVPRMPTRNWVRAAFLAVSARQMKTNQRRAKRAQSLQNINSSEHVMRAGSAFPPQRTFAKKRTEVRRFVQNAAVANQGFSLANGHDQFLAITSALGAAVPYVDCWRIKKIDVWAISEGNNHTTVTLTPVGTDLTSNMRNDREQIFSITSRSEAQPAHMEIVTSKEQPLGSWHFTSATNFAGTLFAVNVQIGGGASQYRVTMDITFEVVDNLAGSPLGYGVTTATTVLGTIGGRNILAGMALQGINNLG